MRAEIEKLIERLEKLTGPDRELDLEIAKLAGGHDWLDIRWAELGTLRFTKSIDTALTLVPEGMFWACAPSWDLREHRIYKPYDGGTLQWPEWKGEHKHDAIALCIASLRARLQGDRP